MQLDDKLYKEIKEYCELNKLKTRDFIHDILKKAFLKEKYGETPFEFNSQEVTVHIEPSKSETLIEKTVETSTIIETEKSETNDVEFVEILPLENNKQLEEIVKIKKKRKLN